MNKQYERFVVAAVTASLSSPLAVYAAGPAEEVQLEEITVTGTKRAQVLQDAVQSVTVFEEQDTIGMQNNLDVFKRIPNATVQSGNTLPTIRGLDANGVAYGGNGAVSGARPRMTNYIDGVPRSYSATPDGLSSFWDLEQIEVYRGSQSTQLGRNSLAGALVQTTKDPKFKDEYSILAGVRDQDFTWNTAFMANKKISDQVAVRLTGEYAKGDNFIDYSDLNEPSLTQSDKDNASEYKFSRFRLKTLIAPTAIPDLSLKLTLDSERNAANNAIDTISLTGRGRKLTDPFSYSYLNTFNNVASLNALYAINNEWTIDSILSYQRVRSGFRPPPDSNPNPAIFLDFTFSVHETVFEPKLNYQSANSRTAATVGAFYLTRTRNDFGAPGTAFDLQANDDSTTKSLYGDAVFQIAKNWDILAGARFEKDEQERKFSGFGGFFAFDFKAKANVFLPKVGVTYHASEDASISLVTYKGYTAGGGGVTFTTANPYTYKKESAQTTELVTRTQWLDKKLTANANIFYTDFKDLQLNGNGPLGPTDAIIVNAKNAKSYGAELELNYQARAKNNIFASVGLLKTKIVDFSDPNNNASNGNEFNHAPSLTARVGASYELLPNIVASGDIVYTGKRYSDFQNTKDDELDSYSVANLALNYIYKNATITGYANNLFNKYALYSQSTAFNTGNVNAPRTVGLNVKLDF